MKKLIKYLHKIPLIQFSLVLLIISMLLFIPIDSDFFWHLKYGELTCLQGPLSHDPFSHTFSNYQFFDYQWLSHAVIFVLYKTGGFHLMSIFYGSVVITAFGLSLRLYIQGPSKLLSKLVLLFISTAAILSVIGIRTQMISILGLSTIYFLTMNFLKKQKQHKTVYLIPLIFILWANLHPGFLSGIILLVIAMLSEFVKVLLQKFQLFNCKIKDKHDSIAKTKTLLYITILSAFTTLITPFSYKILEQSITFASDSYAQDHIAEWLAPNFHTYSGKAAILYILFTAILLLKTKGIRLTETLIIIVFGAMTLQSIRHFPLFIIVSLPFISAHKNWTRLFHFKFPVSSFLIVKMLFFFSTIIVFASNLFNFIIINTDITKVYEKAGYPYQAVQFLKKQNYEGNILNNYEWGGFLIWAYPEKKVFIDGRMTSWRMDNKAILEEYSEITNLTSPDWKEKLEQYEVRVIITTPSKPIASALEYDTAWSTIYQDKDCIVYHKTN